MMSTPAEKLPMKRGSLKQQKKKKKKTPKRFTLEKLSSLGNSSMPSCPRSKMEGLRDEEMRVVHASPLVQEEGNQPGHHTGISQAAGCLPHHTAWRCPHSVFC